MAEFDMRGQRVNNQYVAGRDINFGSVQNSADLITELEKLKDDFAKAKLAGVVNDDVSTDAEYQLTKAIQQAQKPNPDKKTILDHLSSAKSLIEGITAASGLVTGLVAAITTVQKLFS